MQDPSPLQFQYGTHELSRSAGPLLEMCLAQSRSEGIYFYRFERECHAFELVAWRGLPPGSVPSVHVELGARAQQWLLALDRTLLWEAPAWQDWRLEDLPEFVENRFEIALTIPLTARGLFAGIVNFTRRGHDRFLPHEADFLGGLQTVFGSLLEGTLSRDENARLKADLDKTTDRLAGRKQIERAKGILQARHRWTEEEAYLHLRRLSRHNRTPLREIASHVIEGGAYRRSPEAFADRG